MAVQQGMMPGASGQSMTSSMQVTPGAAPQGITLPQIMQALEQAISQTIDQQGYVDLKALISAWPQIAQQLGIDIPFGAILNLISSNPQILNELVAKLGLAGITVDGRQISAEELASMGGGPNAAPSGVPPTGGPTNGV